MLGFHTAIPGLLQILARMLCKDITNPNYKAAHRRTIIIVVQSLVLYILGLQTLIKSVYPGILSNSGVSLDCYSTRVFWHLYGLGLDALHSLWLPEASQLILIRFRQGLPILGFTTIGLNSTLVSRASAMVSSVASIASTASVADVTTTTLMIARIGDKKENENDVAGTYVV